MGTLLKHANEDEVARAVGLIATIGRGAEYELDVKMYECGILLQMSAGCEVHVPKQYVSINRVIQEDVVIQTCGDLAAALRETASQSYTQFEMVLFGIPTMMLIMLDCESLQFNAECVFEGDLPPYSEQVKRAEVVRAWCEAVTRLGIMLGASRVECDVMDALNPVRLWERPAIGS
ncbi:MAG: hypothetical protein KF864_00020 [Phycisphaeraceae bacterium]|nr:hypothetical protein [Phycisphaeraceae bacterium]